MKTLVRPLAAFLASLLLLPAAVHAQPTAFSYQGSLSDSGQPANGSYDLEFALYNAATNGTQVGATLTNLATGVTNGLFMLTLDFGAPPYNGQALWLQVSARTNGAATFVPLSPLQALASVPYAVQSINATSSSAVAAGISITNPTITGATISGNGAGLTSLSPTSLSGPIGDSLLPTNVVTTVGGELVNVATNVYASAGTNTLTIPAGVSQVVFDLWGAGGAGGSNVGAGGGGAFAQRTLPAVAGQTYLIVVGQGGVYNANNTATSSGDAAGGAVPGGGNCAQGGQASSVFYVYGTSNILEGIAGGGGGSASTGSGQGGAGGSPGQDGSPVGTLGGYGGYGASGGTAGTGNSGNGGVGGNYAASATSSGISSLSLAGGDGGAAATLAGSGGGGFGGGGGGAETSTGGANGGGGGGGGSYGNAIIGGTNSSPGNIGDPNYHSGAGAGATVVAGTGGNGLVVVIYQFSGTGATVSGALTANSFTGSGAGLTSLNAAQLTGTLPSSVIPSTLTATLIGNASTATLATNALTATLASNVVSGISITNPIITGATISGNGAGLINVAATNLAGAIGDAQLPTNVVTVSSSNIVVLATNIYATAGTNTVTIPAGVNRIVVKLWGGGGANGLYNASENNNTGGGGAFVQKTLSVVPGQTYTIVVGEGGLYNANNASISSGDAGSGSVGPPYQQAQGGQASSLFYSNGTDYIMEAVAGAGGGGAYDGATGGAGGLSGHAGAPDAGYGNSGGAGGNNGVGGGGGTGNGGAPSGGAGGNYAANATNTGVSSLSLAGGNGGNASQGAGASGGGGYGGGGAAGGDGNGGGAGGGGGSYGDIIIGGTNNSPGNSGDPNYQSNAGGGGIPNAAPGTNGLAVAIFEFSGNGAAVSGSLSATDFAGGGAGLTGLNAAQLTGTLPSAVIPSTITATLIGNATTATLAANASTALLASNVVSPIAITNATISGTLTGNASTATLATNSLTTQLASNVVTGISITNPTITGATISGNGGGLTSINATTLLTNGIVFTTTGLTIKNGMVMGVPLNANNMPILLKAAGDVNHGIGYVTSVTNFTGVTGGAGQALPDGPAVWGYNGGTLAAMNPPHASLIWTSTNVNVYGTFNNNSDRNAKERITSASPNEILDKVLGLTVSRWSYKTDPDTRHIGPMAQDFHAAFNVGTDERSIAPIDEGGVALAAIQALNQKLEAEDAALKAQVKMLQDEVKALQDQPHSAP